MTNEVVEYDVNAAEIAKMSDIYLKLTIDGLEDKEGFESVHSVKMVMVKHRTSVDKLRKSTNAKLQREKEKALQAASDKLEADKKAEKERKYRESFEKKATEDAAIQAEKDAKALVLMLANEKERVEKPEDAENKRQSALFPDKTKLRNYADLIHALQGGNFSMKSKEAKEIYETTVLEISQVEDRLRARTEEL